MATLILSAVGSLVGGPIGGAIGAIAGRQIDAAIIGNPRREGPRLKELSVTTSSYGAPIARHHGTMRAAGTIVWATDLVESRESSGGGKGRPKTTTFSYSTSFAVAISSRPIDGIGRIWADGNLLRGAAGDLKTGGVLRIYKGHGDQQPDPFIAAAEGGDAPAFRDSAYVVFEDLQLADFGNRIPALTFEVFADQGALSLASLIEPVATPIKAERPLPALEGFAFEAGSVLSALATIDELYPISSKCGGDGLEFSAADAPTLDPRILPEAVIGWEDGDVGRRDGMSRLRKAGAESIPQAVRYYDRDRDFLPGIQRSNGHHRTGRNNNIEFPGVFQADAARALANSARQRGEWQQERLSWRLAELDPALEPGATVYVPGRSGLWRIHEWEWRERGVDLQLYRMPPVAPAAPPGSTGAPSLPLDTLPWETWFEALQLPWDGRDIANQQSLFLAASAGGSSWQGASLFVERGSALEPIGTSGRGRATVGSLAAPLHPSGTMLLDRRSTLTIDLLAADMSLQPASIGELSNGANRISIGDEVLQFACATQISDHRWELTQLLRGRGGTEFAAWNAHPAGARAVLLDGSVIRVAPTSISNMPGTRVAAIGFGDETPSFAKFSDPLAPLRPLSPVHPRAKRLPDGSMRYDWIRRARGAWEWLDYVDVPLVEQSESYQVGVGLPSFPDVQWITQASTLSLTASEYSDLLSSYPLADVWVRQVGSHGVSRALLLDRLT